ncbi:hypothetical protein LUR56_39580, partial [Streptomyces sp. MT29]|nr:hypothetical protein [Streptomyces sp. MT29]
GAPHNYGRCCVLNGIKPNTLRELIMSAIMEIGTSASGSHLEMRAALRPAKRMAEEASHLDLDGLGGWELFVVMGYSWAGWRKPRVSSSALDVGVKGGAL